MCFYRYYYFPSCRHQQTVLVEYCDKAGQPRSDEPVGYAEHGESAMTDTMDSQPSRSNVKTKRDCTFAWKQQMSSGKRVTTSRSDGMSYTISPARKQVQQQASTVTLRSTSSPLSSPASPESAAIAEELISSSPSSILQQSAASHHSLTSINMALPAFRQWVDAGALKQTADTNHATAQIVRLLFVPCVRVQY
nr:hypothetical protein CFP56_66823 [Quercus suber]